VAALNWKSFDKELLKKLKNINNKQKAEAELALIIKKCQKTTLSHTRKTTHRIK
jgi:hypothetical protein